MKKKTTLCFIVLLLFCAAAAAGDNLVDIFFNGKMDLLWEDLENHNFKRLIHYFDPGHLQGNINTFLDGEFDLSDESIDQVLVNWGFMTDGGGIHSIRDIVTVERYYVQEGKIYFKVVLQNGKTAILFAAIDWGTLLLSGASG